MIFLQLSSYFGNHLDRRRGVREASLLWRKRAFSIIIGDLYAVSVATLINLIKQQLKTVIVSLWFFLSLKLLPVSQSVLQWWSQRRSRVYEALTGACHWN